MWKAFWLGFAATLGYKFAHVAVDLARPVFKLAIGLLLVWGIFFFELTNPDEGLKPTETSYALASVAPSKASVSDAQSVDARPAESRSTIDKIGLSAQKVPPQSLDTKHQQRVSTECGGMFSIFCSERIRWELCDGRWTEEPPRGETICRSASKVGQ